ncbi:MAG: UDP-N-acetylmuramoyl-L-alanyl-D-glutamate--2,6-diaminopimelate ligase [Betaproteobacteria bacterium]
MRILHTPEQAAQWLHSRVTGELRTDSRQLQAGDGFIAWPGAAADGRAYVGGALAQGGAACLVEHAGLARFGFDSEAIGAYPGLKADAGAIAAEYYGHPSRELDVLAVTGTNGKTSTTWWLAQALSNLGATGGARCGLIGTLGVGVPPCPDALTEPLTEPLAGLESTGLTTPDPVLLQRQLRRFVQQGLTFCAVEASSIGLVEHRLDGTRIRVALFTNFTQDHLDYHGDMPSYWQAKAALFSWPGLQAAVLNLDDEQGAALAQTLSEGRLDLWTVSRQQRARLRALDLAYDAQGLRFTLAEGDERVLLQTALIGDFNVSNLLGVIAALRSLGVGLKDAVQACTRLTPVPGRMDCLTAPGQPLVVVDYAHTPDALDKALTALRPLTQQRSGKLWCVFGCGGDRDSAKRPMMAAVAHKHADRVVLTSDNPRSERPEAIIAQLLLGLSHREGVQVQADRAAAIRQTLEQAQPHDVVLIAGKGHENTQEVAGVKHAFSDKAQALAALAARASAC